MKSFQDCLPADPERWARAFQAWSKVNKIYCGRDLTVPDAKEKIAPVIDAPHHEEMEEIEVAKEMRRRPHRPKRVR